MWHPPLSGFPPGDSHLDSEGLNFLGFDMMMNTFKTGGYNSLAEGTTVWQREV